MVCAFLCLNALNLASAWCLEHDFVRLRKVSRAWYRAFEYVPDEVVQTRIESQHSNVLRTDGGTSMGSEMDST